MSVIGLIFILVLIAVACWLVNAKLPISPGWKMFINVILAVIAVVLCLVAFGIWDEIKGMKVPKI